MNHLSVISDDALVQTFLKVATLREAIFFHQIQSADLEGVIYCPEAQFGEYVPDASLFAQWISTCQNPSVADIAAWISREYDLEVLCPKVQTLAKSLHKYAEWAI